MHVSRRAMKGGDFGHLDKTALQSSLSVTQQNKMISAGGGEPFRATKAGQESARVGSGHVNETSVSNSEDRGSGGTGITGSVNGSENASNEIRA